MIIYLIRHGQTTGDVEDRYGGDYDDHLTDLGKNEAQELADKLKNLNLQKLFVSPRIRAVETADILKNILNVNYEILENLRERNHYGILSGMIKKEAKEQYPQEAEKVKDYRTCARDGEEYSVFLLRVTKVFKEISTQPYAKVGVITHGGVIRAVYREILKKGEIDLEDCSYSVLECIVNNFQYISSEGITIK
jgi:broad specificity phosphatase PhoE